MYNNLTIKERIENSIKKVKCINIVSLKFHNEKDLYCWEWQKCKFKDGYGQIGINYKKHRTHRISYQKFIGPIPKGKCVLHKCDTRSCCNPNHLFIGTKKDNAKDRDLKKRGTIGERNGCSKLTRHQVIQIRNMWKTGDYTYLKLSNNFNIQQMQAWRIINNKRWKHIGG